jgi:hypothetical protein
MKVETGYLEGMLYALISIILGVLFTLANGKLIEKHDSSVISLYEFMGVFFISIYYLYQKNSQLISLFCPSILMLILIWLRFVPLCVYCICKVMEIKPLYGDAYH